MAKEKKLSSKVVYEGRAFRIRMDTVQKSSGQSALRDVLERSDCIAVVAVDAEDNVLLERQFRTAAGKELLEIPAGGIDPGEDPETAVKREMREETGYFPQKVTRLGGFYASPGYSTEYLYLFLATDLTPSQLFAEDTDEIELVRVPVSKIRRLILSGEIDDAKSIAGLLMYLEKIKAPGS
ncbi:MAG: NUDIX hydrolase [Dehalococcoidales bacterium]|nr:NUDIX hydrolase [Dehalococcoidales bacterium]